MHNQVIQNCPCLRNEASFLRLKNNAYGSPNKDSLAFRNFARGKVIDKEQICVQFASEQ